MNTKQKVLNLLDKGLKAPQISKKLGISLQYVYTIKSDAKREAAKGAIAEKIIKNWPKKPTKLIVKPQHLEKAVALLNAHNQPADLVNSPPHYTKGGIDFLDYAEAKGLVENAYLFNVVKYISRAGKKVGSDPIEDLKKAEFYLKREIANRERA